MFSTPLLHTGQRENVDSIMKKPQLLSARKAFQDQDVNSKLNMNQSNVNVPIVKKQLLCTPKKKVNIEDETPEWEMTMLRRPPIFELPMFYSPIKENDVIYTGLLTPPASPKWERLQADDLAPMPVDYSHYQYIQEDPTIPRNDDLPSIEMPAIDFELLY